MLPRIRTREPRLLTLGQLAHETGISPSSVRYLTAQNVLRPLLVETPVRAPMRLFTQDDVQRILAHYRERGGIRALSRK